MNTYELTLILNPKLSDKDKETLLLKVLSIVEKEGGKVEKKEEWGKKALTYPIKKFTEGFYEFLTLEMEPKIVVIVNKKIRLEENIIRYLLVKKEV